MKFEVTYRLTHPESLPAVAHTTLSARSHRQLDGGHQHPDAQVAGTGLCPSRPGGEKEAGAARTRKLNVNTSTAALGPVVVGDQKRVHRQRCEVSARNVFFILEIIIEGEMRGGQNER